MDLHKVLLNIIIQFCKGTLRKKSAFFILLIFILIFGSDSFSQGRLSYPDKKFVFLSEENFRNYENSKKNLLSDKSIIDFNTKSDFKKRDLIYNIINFDTLKNPKDSIITFKMKKNPWKAVLYSALLPGLGQFYNESYWKIPIVAVAGGYLGYIIVKNHSDFLEYRDLYAESQTPEKPDGDTRLKEFREFYRNQRDQFLLYFLFFYVITAVDAYVDANLFDFDVSDYMMLSAFRNNSILNLSIGF